MDRLSSILNETPRFSFFNELVSIPSPLVLQHDLFKINKIIDDIIGYLYQVLRLFDKVKSSKTASSQIEVVDLEYYFEGKDEITGIIQNIHSIDMIITQLLEALDSSPSQKLTNQLLDKFEQTSDLLLEVKKNTIVCKKKLDVAINYKDMERVIESIVQEVEDCEKMSARMLLELQLSLLSPARADLLQYGLENIISKMHGQSMVLPTFTADEEEQYEAWLSLHTRLQPLRVSLDFLPMRMGEFEQICQKNNKLTSHIDSKYKHLLDKWNELHSQTRKIKHNLLVLKWNEVFIFLIHEVAKTCSHLFLQAKTSQMAATRDENFSKLYKLCSTTINIINKAFAEEVVSDTKLIILFNEELLPKWHMLNDMLTSMTISPRLVSSSSFQSNSQNSKKESMEGIGLRPYRILKKSPSPEAIDNGYGIDLGMDIQKVEVPYSIQQKDKVRDFFKQTRQPPLRLQKVNLQSLNIEDFEVDVEEDEDDDYDTSTLVTSKRFISLEEKEINQGLASITIEQTKQEKWALLRRNSKFRRSLLPLIQPDHLEGNYPRIQMIIVSNSRIPVISPNHPVHHSLNLKPPVVVTRKKSSNDMFVKPTGKPSIIGRKLLVKSIPDTLPLPFQSPTWRSSSPERPMSAMGSRYDEEHLVHPIQSPKRWR